MSFVSDAGMMGQVLHNLVALFQAHDDGILREASHNLLVEPRALRNVLCHA